MGRLASVLIIRSQRDSNCPKARVKAMAASVSVSIGLAGAITLIEKLRGAEIAALSK
jgi:hypothetical protein